MRMKRTVSQQSDVNGDCSAGFTSYNEKSEPSIECDVSKGVTRESELADSHCRANAHRAKIAGHNRLVKVNHLTRRQVAATVNTAGIPRPVTRAAQWDAAGRLERFLPHIQRNTPQTERSLVPVLSKCFERSYQTIYPFIIKSKAVSRPTYDVELPTRRRKMKEGGREEEPTNAAEEVQGSRTERTCCCLGVLVGVSLIAALVAVILMKDTTVEVTVLRQVHVLMSHGERTPSERELAMLGAPPPEHVFAPYGAGALTNEGKMATFEMGALLRKRYNQFLGPYYEDGKHVVITSDTDLSKVSALLISAGLWPPPAEQVWNDTMQWQPVPYSYPPRDTDYLLYEENCPRYNQEKERILQAFTEEGLLAPYRDFFHKIATLTNTNFSTPREAFYLNNLFTIQDDIKVANPKWAKHVKRKLMDIARLEFMMMFHNNLLKKLSGGALLNQIIKESLESGSGRSLVVRIGSPVSVAALLAACVAPPPRSPDPGAALIIELHERLPSNEHKAVDPIAKRYGFKIYYWDDDSAEPRLIEVVGCEAFCSLETFKHLTQQVLSYDYKEDCKLVPTDINIGT